MGAGARKAVQGLSRVGPTTAGDGVQYLDGGGRDILLRRRGLRAISDPYAIVVSGPDLVDVSEPGANRHGDFWIHPSRWRNLEDLDSH